LVSKLSPGVLWIGVENIITLTGDSMSENVFIKSEDAEIKIDKGSFVAIVNPINVNTDITIDAYRVSSQDSIKLISRDFFVKKIPDPTYSIEGRVVDNVISRTALLKAKKIDVILGDGFPNGEKLFLLTSFDLEIDDKIFHSNSNTLTTSMVYYLTNTTSKSIRIFNDTVNGFNEVRFLYKDKTFVLDE